MTASTMNDMDNFKPYNSVFDHFEIPNNNDEIEANEKEYFTRKKRRAPSFDLKRGISLHY